MVGKLVGCFQRQNTHGLLDVIDKCAQKLVGMLVKWQKNAKAIWRSMLAANEMQ